MGCVEVIVEDCMSDYLSARSEIHVPENMDALCVGPIRDDDDPLSARSLQRCAYYIQFLGCVGDRGIQDVDRFCRYTLFAEHPDVEIGFPGVVNTEHVQIRPRAREDGSARSSFCVSVVIELSCL